MITDSGPLVLLDIGANPDSTAENLAQYARMGAIFAEKVLGVADPRVALLSIGEEKGKGDARIQRATELLDASTLRFVGNVEGKRPHQAHGRRRRHRRSRRQRRHQVLRGPVRRSSSTCGATEFRASWRGQLAYLLMRPSIGRIRSIFDYETHGGSPLLGVKGTVDHHPRPAPSGA